MDDDTQMPADSNQGAPQADWTANDNPAPQTTDNNDWSHPGTPLMDTPSEPAAEVPTPAEVVAPMPTMPEMPAVPSAAPEGSLVTASLTDLKQKAIGDLSPLLSHLDQTPEDKFRTTMMMIQATDDKGLIQSAYDAANAIPDEKAKAQALLDVINEINYFTHTPQHEV